MAYELLDHQPLRHKHMGVAPKHSQQWHLAPTMSKTSPTQRSLKLLRQHGYFVAVTERWNPFSKTRNDLYGFVDLLAIQANDTLAVQTTSGPNLNARLDKLLTIPAVKLWLESPTRRIELHGWRKIGQRGKRKTWEVRKIDLTREMLT